MVYTLRLMTSEDDLLAVSRIYVDTWQTAYRGIVPQPFLDSLSPERRASSQPMTSPRPSLLLLEGETPIGVSSFGRGRLESKKDWGEIVSLYLLPAYWGRGYGRMLMDGVLSQLSRMGYQDIYLWALEKNHRARRFYERYGFTLSGETKIDSIGGKELTEVQYVLRLPR